MSKWICEAMGKEEFEHTFETKEEAMEMFNQFVEGYRNQESQYECFELEDGKFEVAGYEYYQNCSVYERPETVKDILLDLVNHAEQGLTQYQWELADSWTCGCFLDMLKNKISELDSVVDLNETRSAKLKNALIKGFESGDVRVVNDMGIRCLIGNSSFYFTENKDEDISAEEYCKLHSKEEIIDKVAEILDNTDSAEEAGIGIAEREYYLMTLDVRL